MIELSLLRTFFQKENLEAYKNLLNPKTLSRQSLILIKDFEAYFGMNQVDVIDLNNFTTFFFQTRHSNLNDKSILEYKEIFKLLEEQDKNQDVEKLVYGFKQQVLYDDIKRLLDKNEDLELVKSKLDKFLEENQREVLDDVFHDMELSEAQEYTDRSKGLRWRSKALNEYFRDGGVILGDFILIAGFVGCGKSSFIASEVTKMAQQLEGDDYILWMSNEGSYKALIERMYSAALNATSQEMRGDEARQKARASYIKGMKGNLNRIRIIDIQGWNAKQIEQLIAKRTPKLAIIDLVDHIEGFDKYSTKENSFEKYGKLYQWCREVATKYCPVFGISQLNGEGENNMYPMMSQMRGSRVDKQAAASAVLMIGSIVGDNTTRYLSIPKSKINEVSDWTAVVQFDASRSRFI